MEEPRVGNAADELPQPGDIALPAEFHKASYEAFSAYGCAL
jgi:hypothetical protein